MKTAVASPAQELTQDWPVDSAVCVEDMIWDGGEVGLTPARRRQRLHTHAVVSDSGAYTHGCRCGGAFAISEEEMRKPGGEEEEGEDGGLVVCCDTCSLSVLVTAQKRPPQLHGPV